MSAWEKIRKMHGRMEKGNTEDVFTHIVWKNFRQNKMAMISVCVLLLIVAVSYIAPLFYHISYSDINLDIITQAPSKEHLLGTDEYGRDVLIRLIYGGRISISVALSAMGIQVVMGTVIGAAAGYLGGIVDAVLMRITDVFMCFPFYIMAVALSAILGAGLRNSIIIIGFLQWPGLARIVRAQILSVKENDYVMAARSLGIPSGQIVIKHVLPNVLSPIIVSATLSIAGSIMAEASLSFLGLGVAIPRPSWGNMLSAAQSMKALNEQWWLWMPPGFMIVIVVGAVNYIGEGIEHAMNPKAGV